MALRSVCFGFGDRGCGSCGRSFSGNLCATPKQGCPVFDSGGNVGLFVSILPLGSLPYFLYTNAIVLNSCRGLRPWW